MVKFFLKNQKHPPKSHSSQKKKQTSKSKSKKVLDYRIVIWKKLFKVIKTEHTLMVQKIIRKIKQTKQKLQLRQGETTSEVNNQVKINQLNKDLTSLDGKYQAMKSIKKPQLKQVTLYIILQVLKIQNIEKILQKAKLDKSLETQKLKESLQNNQSVKKFIQKLSLLTVYQKELQDCAQLVDLVQEKKLERKTKFKERRDRKYQREQAPKQHHINRNPDQEKSYQNDDQQISSQQELIQDETQKKQPAQPIKKFQKNSNNHYQHQNKTHRQQQNSKPFQKQFQNTKKSYNKQKPIQKQRTQFRKTGRNKVKYEKEQKKLHFKNKGKEAKQHQHNSSKQKQVPKNKQKQVPQRKGQFAFSKEQAHPSWKAKQELKQEVYIQPFQGKKILL